MYHVECIWLPGIRHAYFAQSIFSENTIFFSISTCSLRLKLFDCVKQTPRQDWHRILKSVCRIADNSHQTVDRLKRAIAID